ncbi:Uncharacterised protein [Yersinia frederiksenii]|nr:Uncharacterised protein [Yersinia frederiksenii]CNL11209.1 Uncharacterised protein [Yersinia frederiksenii]CQH28472.1 Uncharacterised protein [Yersinia frederiksenii]
MLNTSSLGNSIVFCVLIVLHLQAGNMHDTILSYP